MSLLEDEGQALSLCEVYTVYICMWWCGHPAVSVQSFKVPIPGMRCLFSVGDLQVTSTQVLGTWVLWLAAPQHAVYLGQSEFDPPG